jgi:hypothetical protein
MKWLKCLTIIGKNNILLITKVQIYIAKGETYYGYEIF